MSSFFYRVLTFSFILSTTCLATASAQEAPQDTTVNVWDFGGVGTINFSQVSLKNWASGGQNALSALGIGNLYANYKKGKNTWNNSLDVTYGNVKLQNQRLRKSDDRVELNLKYGRQASPKWYYTGQFNLKTQLTPTYTENRDSVLSDFLSPAYVLASIGMDYKPNDKLSVFISPVTGKLTLVENQRMADFGAYGVAPAIKDAEGNIIPGTGERLREEFGGFVNVRFKQELMQNVTLQSKVDFFSNYMRNPQNVDMNWENLLNFKVNKFISTSLFVHLVYDDDIDINVDKNGDGEMDGKGPRLQVKQTLGVGLSYKFD